MTDPGIFFIATDHETEWEADFFFFNCTIILHRSVKVNFIYWLAVVRFSRDVFKTGETIRARLWRSAFLETFLLKKECTCTTENSHKLEMLCWACTNARRPKTGWRGSLLTLARSPAWPFRHSELHSAVSFPQLSSLEHRKNNSSPG